MRNVRVRPVIATLILAAAITTFGCRAPLSGRGIMTDKPSKTPVVLRDTQEEVKSPKRILDAVPVPTEKKDAEAETKKEKFNYPHLGFKEHKRVTPILEFK